jgi:hypothetical protein
MAMSELPEVVMVGLPGEVLLEETERSPLGRQQKLAADGVTRVEIGPAAAGRR